MKGQSIQERFWSKVDKSQGECWNWTANAPGKRYGHFFLNGKARIAHRVAYELQKGPIPEGLTIDHLCRNTFCVRGDHLEAVPQRVNTIRGISPIARNANALVCIRGHPLVGLNLYVYPKSGKRACKECQRRKSLRLWHKKIAAGWKRPSRAKS